MSTSDKRDRGDRTPTRGGMGMRTASWRSSRLKPAADDYGFVSKGDSRLLDHKNQEKYYTTIVEKYLKFCGSADNSKTLDHALSTALILPTPPNTDPTTAAASTSKNTRFADPSNSVLASLLLSMRKLREGLVASSRLDTFTVQAYTFIIRASILMAHAESYHPALLHLLYTLHPLHPLPPMELQEFAGYHMLHLACGLEDYAGAYEAGVRFGVTDYRVRQAVGALVHGDYWGWRVIKRKVDLYKGRLLEGAEKRVRVLALKCVGKAYFTVEVGYVEAVMGMEWEEVRREFAVGWEMGEGEVLTVRRQKGRAKPAVQEPVVQAPVVQKPVVEPLAVEPSVDVGKRWSAWDDD
ncbi:uncharacterized protein H6S33_006726 [Morchella sextelata]|uniref:uncharacterized protein n=1 Tax=Morchella sextelata TaxID=1174677 RepID=UPI001D04A2C6|nr:uncharacterized protein H6S33_006726 [Morchella sextelata]KAH0604349.1 hypothetical protein H6S33_006726 [Morchella sextelata]